ncbi:MAG: hypothetical protein KIT87_06240 [Anaerolineae bacterium]|nr:hypothetical protein [Anaerolineae bacterium]
MSVPLSPDRVAQLLPALDPLAETLARRGRLEVADLQVILLGLGLDEDWASQELERWAAILATAHDPDRAPWPNAPCCCAACRPRTRPAPWSALPRPRQWRLLSRPRPPRRSRLDGPGFGRQSRSG